MDLEMTDVMYADLEQAEPGITFCLLPSCFKCSSCQGTITHF
jgi:hypothetical protein